VIITLAFSKSRLWIPTPENAASGRLTHKLEAENFYRGLKRGRVRIPARTREFEAVIMVEVVAE
jgi:hypothetical protein